MIRHPRQHQFYGGERPGFDLSGFEWRKDRLELPLMVSKNTDNNQTAFTVSIDAVHGVSTGIWAEDRARTIQVAIHPDTKPQDLRRPGHIFPLRAIVLITMCQLRQSGLTFYLEKRLRLGLG